MIFIHRETGVRGDAAKELMASFIREKQDKLWTYVAGMDEPESPTPGIRSVVVRPNEVARQPRPRKHNYVPSPLQLEEPDEISLEEPPMMIPSTGTSSQSWASLAAELACSPSLSADSCENEETLSVSYYNKDNQKEKVVGNTTGEKEKDFQKPKDKEDSQKEIENVIVKDKQSDKERKAKSDKQCDKENMNIKSKQNEKEGKKDKHNNKQAGTKKSNGKPNKIREDRENQDQNQNMDEKNKNESRMNKKDSEKDDASNSGRTFKKASACQKKKEKGIKEGKTIPNEQNMKDNETLLNNTILDDILNDITNTYYHSQNFSPIRDIAEPQKDCNEPVNAVAISAEQMEDVYEKAVEIVSESATELVQETVLEEQLNEAQSKMLEESIVIEKEVGTIIDQEIQNEISTIARESLLDCSLAAAEEKRLRKERKKQKKAERAAKEAENIQMNNETCEGNLVREEIVEERLLRKEEKKRRKAEKRKLKEHEEQEESEVFRIKEKQRKAEERLFQESEELSGECAYLQRIQKNRIVLNIGGVRFETSRRTLQKDPHSLLAALVSEESTVQPQGSSIFIDRDPSHFKLILNYLRCDCNIACSSLLPRERKYLLELECECDYYRIYGLRKVVRRRLKQLTELYGMEWF